MYKARFIATAFLCLLLATPAWADFDEGWAAYQRGDYATALREYRPLAEQGGATAQYNLGLMYANGQGVPQDYVQAHKWLNLAATQGNKNAVKNRDNVAKKMTPADISKAQQLAREWWAAFNKRKAN